MDITNSEATETSNSIENLDKQHLLEKNQNNCDSGRSNITNSLSSSTGDEIQISPSPPLNISLKKSITKILKTMNNNNDNNNNHNNENDNNKSHKDENHHKLKNNSDNNISSSSSPYPDENQKALSEQQQQQQQQQQTIYSSTGSGISISTNNTSNNKNNNNNNNNHHHNTNSIKNTQFIDIDDDHDNKLIVNNKTYEELKSSSSLTGSPVTTPTITGDGGEEGADNYQADGSRLSNKGSGLKDSTGYYDRNLYFGYRESQKSSQSQNHNNNVGDKKDDHYHHHHHHNVNKPLEPVIIVGGEGDIENRTTDMNEVYDNIKEHDNKRKEGKFRYFKYLFDKNKYRWDPIQNRRFFLAAQIITRFGFFSKTLLYACLGIMSIAAAVDKRRAVKGPDGVFEELEEIFSSGIIIVFVLGLWSYGCWGLFFVIFDIDQLGHASAGAVLKRFGRVFSSGFYFVLGVDATRVLVHQRKTQSGTSQILGILYSHILGKIVVCVLGVTFFVVSIVYLVYAIKPGKFKRELSTERMTKPLYWTALGFARLGAIGRSMFFGAFGAVLIKAVSDISKGKDPDTSLLGFQGVFQQIALYSATLLFIIAILVVFYALWCCWLMFFRRLPAHSDENYAKKVLGTDINHDYRLNGILFRIPRRNRTSISTEL